MEKYTSFIHPKSGKRYKCLMPDTCPICGAGISCSPNFSNTVHKKDNEGIFYAIFECGHCSQPFMSTYEYSDFPQTITEHSDFPHKLKYKSFDKEIEASYPDFVKIYHQTEYAEYCGLLEICGVGYRKALEFLIKQYAIYNDIENTLIIEKEPLQSTANRIKNEHLRNIATKSIWIGNDFTHYIRKHNQSDISDMKDFIDTLVRWIAVEEQAAKSI